MIAVDDTRSIAATPMSLHHAGNLPLVGGRLCLDFTNTAAFAGSVIVNEHLHRPDALLVWGRHVDLAVGDLPTEADRIEALALRADLRRLLDPADEDDPLPALARLNQTLAAPGVRLEPTPAGYRYLAGAASPLAWLKGPVVLSAADLLASSDQTRVRKCSNPRCGWLFVDGSRGGRRHWCSMALCGNRSKVRAHYQRRRPAAGRAP